MSIQRGNLYHVYFCLHVVYVFSIIDGWYTFNIEVNLNTKLKTIETVQKHQNPFYVLTVQKTLFITFYVKY